MTKTLMRPMLCLTAVLAMLCAPSAFAGHGRWDRDGHDGYRYRGHAGYRYGGHGHSFHRDRYGRAYEHHDHFGNWLAGALVLGAVTDLVVDATQPRVYYSEPPRVYYSEPPVVYENPPVVYSRAHVVYRVEPPVEQVEIDPYQTRYLGYDDGDDGD